MGSTCAGAVNNFSTYSFLVPSIGHTINRMEIITIITRINVSEILVKMKRHGFMASSFKMQHFVWDVNEETNFEFRAHYIKIFKEEVLTLISFKNIKLII